MKVLLDENFPLQLYRALRDAGYQADHIIVSDRRGMSDAEIIEKLWSQNLSQKGPLNPGPKEIHPLPPGLGLTLVW